MPSRRWPSRRPSSSSAPAPRLEPGRRRSPSSAAASTTCPSRWSWRLRGCASSRPRRSSSACRQRLDLLEGRPRRRSPPADAPGDDRVELRPARRRRAAPVRAAWRSSAAAARSRPPRKSRTPISTRSSRSSTRASCEGKRQKRLSHASSCWRRSTTSRAKSSMALGRPRGSARGTRGALRRTRRRSGPKRERR